MAANISAIFLFMHACASICKPDIDPKKQECCLVCNHMMTLMQGVPPTYRSWVWEQVSGAAKLQADHMNNYYEAMVHQGEATSPSARQIDLVRACDVTCVSRRLLLLDALQTSILVLLCTAVFQSNQTLFSIAEVAARQAASSLISLKGLSQYIVMSAAQEWSWPNLISHSLSRIAQFQLCKSTLYI